MKTLLAAIDFSKSTAPVLEQASSLAKALNAELWILHVASDENPVSWEINNGLDAEFLTGPANIPEYVHLARDLCATELKNEHSALLSISANLRSMGIDARAILLKGRPAELILRKAEDLEVDIVLMGSHGHGTFRKALLGSVSESVMRRSSCNVMIIPTIEKETFKFQRHPYPVQTLKHRGAHAENNYRSSSSRDGLHQKGSPNAD
ncbi:MAG: universal stress protein [Pontiellaceae bacterium]|nr:universal stress protein [Pontiellaceae bacterium]